MSVTIKQSDVSNNVRMGVLCYCYTFCGRSVLIGLVSHYSPSAHSGSISTPAASGRDACSRLVWELQPAVSTLLSPHPHWGDFLCLDF